MTETPLDDAHRAMEAAPEDEAARARFYAELADCELYVLLEGDVEGDEVTPVLTEAGGVQYALVFDREERLSEFVGGAASYAALSGRMLVTMLAGRGVGLGVNLDVAPSSILLPEGAVTWLAETLEEAPSRDSARPTSVQAPVGFPQAVLAALGRRLSRLSGMARAAYLVRLTYDSGADGYLLAVEGARPEAEPAIAKSLSEAVVFEEADGLVLDISFFPSGDAALEIIASAGLAFDIPEPEEPRVAEVSAPGMDPGKPPILK